MENSSFPFQVGAFACFALPNYWGDANCNCLLVQTGQHNVLIETGVGDIASPPGLLLDLLQMAGISQTEIDVVILSHADFDHIGGATDASGTPIFPQAQYVLLQDEWDYWSSKPDRLPPSEFFDAETRQLASTIPVTRLAQLHDQLRLVEAGAEIVPGMRAVRVPGHTPGMMAIAVLSGNERLLFIADVLYDADLNHDQSDPLKEIGNPAFHATVDVDPAEALFTRDRLFAQAVSEGTLLMAYHLPFPGLGYVGPHGAGWRWRSLEVAA